MSEESTVTYHPWDKTTTLEEGTTLLEGANDLGLSIESLCGGEGLCGTCKVIIDEGEEHLTPPTQADERVLSDSQLEDGYRLSCRCAVQDDGVVETTVPSVSQNTGGIVLTEGNEMEFELDTAVKKYRLEVDSPTLENNVADRERVFEALEDGYDLEVEDVDHLVQTELPNDMRADEDEDEQLLKFTATVYDEREIVDVQPGYDDTMYGLAIDIGTTTVAVYLLDLNTGEVEAVSSQLNPQSRYGGDIMTRVRYTRRNEGGRQEMQDAIVDGINECIEEVTREADVENDQIYESVFVGNTAMHHLFLGYEPSYVAGSPYVAANHAPQVVKAREIGIDINDSGYLYWLPISGGWVGPDKVSVLLVSGHYKEDEMTVCIDIGTNGEISVGNKDKMWTTSAPAGPALEGAEITHGVRAQAGSIESVKIDPDTFEPTLGIIDDDTPTARGEATKPNGICGSGVIDALAQMFVVGLVDQRGQFREEVYGHDRIRKNEDDEVEYVLVWDEESAIDGDIVVTQNDIREIQMAKAAIQAGALVLMDELDVDTVDRVVLAGGFGNYIDPESAITVGLYPDVEMDKVESLGNAAGIGAQLALLNKGAREETMNIIEEVEYFEIAGTDVFRDNFMQAMYLPHQDLDRYPRVKDRVTSVRDLDGSVKRGR
ncbi:MAG: ASKHA domain-containing protein [Haloarculaceae archaeon]